MANARDYRMAKTLLAQRKEMQQRNRKRLKGKQASVQQDAKKKRYYS